MQKEENGQVSKNGEGLQESIKECDESGQNETQPVSPLTFPDGGWKAWGNIAGCTLISLTAFGMYNNYKLDFQWS